MEKLQPRWAVLPAQGHTARKYGGTGFEFRQIWFLGAVSGASPERMENIPPLGWGLAGDGLVAPPVQHPLRDPLGAPL